jgi:hypothetical protein
MGFEKAVRGDIWFKGLIIGSSGSGKSYTSLRLSKGFANKLAEITGTDQKIAYINTEPNRGEIYADEFNYDIMNLKAPFTPENYINAIEEAIAAGYKILILDSITHEWSGKGGCLEIHSKIPGNSYTAWRTVTPRHESLMDKILDSNIHIFATVRGDDKYVLEEVNGKQVPRKVPLGYDQRKNTEYLFITTFVLDVETHVATTAKDNTHLFETEAVILSEKHGEKLCLWSIGQDVDVIKNIIEERQKTKDELKSGIEEEAKEIEEKKRKETSISLEDIMNEIDTIAKEKAKDNRDEVTEAIKKYHDSANYTTIKTKTTANKVLAELKKVGE